MLMDFKKLLADNNISPKGIIQIGADRFQEKKEFLSCGVKDFVLIEMRTSAFPLLIKAASDIKGTLLFNVAISDQIGVSDIFVDNENNGESSSILIPNKHKEQYPYISFGLKHGIKTATLDSLKFNREKYNILYMDIQGAELKALKGAAITLDYIDCIYTEVNYIELYENCVLFEDLCNYLDSIGFKLVQKGPEQKGWSDAFFVKKSLNEKKVNQVLTNNDIEENLNVFYNHKVTGLFIHFDNGDIINIKDLSKPEYEEFLMQMNYLRNAYVARTIIKENYEKANEIKSKLDQIVSKND